MNNLVKGLRRRLDDRSQDSITEILFVGRKTLPCQRVCRTANKANNIIFVGCVIRSVYSDYKYHNKFRYGEHHKPYTGNPNNI